MTTPTTIASEQSVAKLHYLARALFALLAVIYFHLTAAFFFTLPQYLPWLLFFGYLSLQLGLLIWRPPYKNGIASGLDLLVLGALILMDVGDPPPTIALLFIAALSNGLLHGLKRFLIILAAALAVIAVVLPIRLMHAPEASTTGSLFLVAALVACMLFFGLMIWRNQALAKASLEATWRDPQTGFISRDALISTAGWLVPLHDRISSPLTLALVRHDNLDLLADHIAQRIRRSDVAARYDQDNLALMLPCTATAAAEQLLYDLRDRHEGMRGALMTLNDGDASLEQALAHLQTAMARTQVDDDHWLAHAPPLQ